MHVTGHQAFVTEAVSLGELLHEDALLVLPGGSTPRTLIPVWTLPLRHISSSLSVARPFTNGVEWGWKKCTDPMVGGARSITLYDACTPSSGEYGSTLYVGLARAVSPISPTNTNFRLTFLLTRLQKALYEDLAV